MPFSSSKRSMGARTRATSNTASTEQVSVPEPTSLPSAPSTSTLPTAEHQTERADQDRLAGARFARDDRKSRCELKGEIGHQGEVLDSQRRQHGRIVATNLRVMVRFGKSYL